MGPKTKKIEEDLIKNQDLNNVKEFDDIYHPITKKPVIVMEVHDDKLIVQDEEGNFDEIKKIANKN